MVRREHITHEDNVQVRFNVKFVRNILIVFAKFERVTSKDTRYELFTS